MTASSNGQRPPQIPAPRASFPERVEEDVPWARRSTGRPATSRERRIVRDLPGWDPLPPGENLVRRRARD